VLWWKDVLAFATCPPRWKAKTITPLQLGSHHGFLLDHGPNAIMLGVVS
jgi:hypothetical protein